MRIDVDFLAEQTQAAVGKLVEQAGERGVVVKDALQGTWLGHALHPALVAVPIGAWSTATVLDLLGAQDGADAAVGLGVLAALPTAASGLADWSYTTGKPRRIGLAHGALNSTALLAYSASWLARKAGRRGLGMTLSLVGLSMVGAAGYLGGELSYALGQGVNRNAWSPEVEQGEASFGGFQPVMPIAELRENTLTAAEITLDEKTVPLVLFKRGAEVFALGGSCSHMGAPLAEGSRVDEWCVECPWHGSRFDFRDGSVDRGPAAYAQPRFETRVENGMLEVRPATSPAETVDRLLASI